MIPDSIIDLTDSGLFNLVKMGDAVAFKELFKRYWSKLYFYSYNILNEKDLCEDIVQEIFADVWLRRNEIQIDDLRNFLYQSVRNQIFKHFRRSRYKSELINQLNLFLEETGIEENFDRRELREKIDLTVSQLPEQRRMIFHLSRNEELSNKEISQKLNISIQTVKNQISKALQFIRKSVKNLNSILW